jgi:hypothetical protein
VEEFNMDARIIITVTLAFTLTLFTSLRAADGDKPKAPGGPAGQAKLLLEHADDLGLTPEQKTKLEDISKGPMNVLTADQKKKAREFMPKAAPKAKKTEADDAAKKTEAEKKPDADAKPDAEKKPDTEKKPDDVKKDDEKK